MNYDIVTMGYLADFTIYGVCITLTIEQRRVQKEIEARREYAVAARRFVDAEAEFDKAIYNLVSVLDSAK